MGNFWDGSDKRKKRRVSRVGGMGGGRKEGVLGLETKKGRRTERGREAEC